MRKYKEKKFHSKVVHSCKYQVVWCTQNQRDILKDEVALRLKEIIEESMDVEEVEGEIINLEISPSYVHLIVSVNPQFGIDKLVRHLKRKTSGPLREEFSSVKGRVSSTWTLSYYVSTLDSSTPGAIKEYLMSQQPK
ncbi:IS200/IS605 family transposase [Bacillus megaterium]|nr:IS200/IS605 family transposase [Priestia megaterium]